MIISKNMQLFQIIIEPIPIISPYNNISIFCDLIHLIFILINIVKIPLEISFDISIQRYNNIDFASQIVFLSNFLLTLNTAYYYNGVLEKTRSKIIKHYFQKKFILDLIAYYMLWFVPFQLQIFKITFIIIKFLNYYSIIEKITDAFQLSSKYSFIISIFTLLIEVVFLCHVFACMWHGQAQIQIQNGSLDTWLHKQQITESSVYTRYVYSIYFSAITIGTVGYGDITPNNDLERLFISCVAIISSGIFAYILSNIQNVFREYREKQEDYRLQLIDMNTYMMNREVNPQLQQMARKYLEYVNAQGYNHKYIPSDSLNNLSQILKKEITQEIFLRSIQKIPFFQKNFSEKLQKAISDKMQEISYGPDEVIQKNEAQIPRLYIILKGQVELYVDNYKALIILLIKVNRLRFQRKIRYLIYMILFLKIIIHILVLEVQVLVLYIISNQMTFQKHYNNFRKIRRYIIIQKIDQFYIKIKLNQRNIAYHVKVIIIKQKIVHYFFINQIYKKQQKLIQIKKKNFDKYFKEIKIGKNLSLLQKCNNQISIINNKSNILMIYINL
ncbi:cation channel family protein, putative [Ichthyophthirius multifiliis]|uniref:Cation channel family protein, putative n=1 Tax=Ichthyophthirius multifiliis TaxID=5932 RepID=G0QRV2_ICHMU|nr:cation channel family protein, putative [Ichthyophthirius multifiliis]EGR32054.1 cation channel family protein, putative [Ichthyophthirius multifiliis]|eukprot:XP_004035540.1 cation channel family protein, putative [Ichthyophthirius multifiliis]